MPLPRALARFNKVATNRVGLVLAPRVRGGAVIVHRGRTSGRQYRTPISSFRRSGGYAAALTYGPGAEWVQNVLAAGHAILETRDGTIQVTNPRVIHDPRYRLVPRLVGDILGLLGADAFLLLDERSRLRRTERRGSVTAPLSLRPPRSDLRRSSPLRRSDSRRR